MKLNIAFDIDGCFVDIMSQVEKRLARENIKIVANGKYHIETDPYLSVDELWDRFIACYRDFNSIPIYPGATDLCRLLYQMSGCPIQFVTTRPDIWASYTCMTVDRFCDVPYSIGHVKDGRSKVNYLNGQTHFVEDRRSTARDIAATGRTVYVPRRNWNVMPDQPGIIKINGIHELLVMAEEFVTFT
jgi:hypothetical protein